MTYAILSHPGLVPGGVLLLVFRCGKKALARNQSGLTERYASRLFGRRVAALGGRLAIGLSMLSEDE